MSASEALKYAGIYKNSNWVAYLGCIGKQCRIVLEPPAVSKIEMQECVNANESEDYLEAMQSPLIPKYSSFSASRAVEQMRGRSGLFQTLPRFTRRYFLKKRMYFGLRTLDVSVELSIVCSQRQR